jgi:hypothetical protein
MHTLPINKLFEREKLVPLKVIQMMLDFEKATWKALKSIYSGVDLVGCYFHWFQAVHKRMEQEGLAKSTTSSEDRRMCRLLLALPLLPRQLIKRSFESIMSQATGPLLVCVLIWIANGFPERFIRRRIGQSFC